MNGSKILQTLDANEWSKEFIDTFKDRKEEIDLNLMRTWFANAIMCGYDFRQREIDSLRAKIQIAYDKGFDDGV